MRLELSRVLVNEPLWPELVGLREVHRVVHYLAKVGHHRRALGDEVAAWNNKSFLISRAYLIKLHFIAENFFLKMTPCVVFSYFLHPF